MGLAYRAADGFKRGLEFQRLTGWKVLGDPQRLAAPSRVKEKLQYLVRGIDRQVEVASAGPSIHEGLVRQKLTLMYPGRSLVQSSRYSSNAVKQSSYEDSTR